MCRILRVPEGSGRLNVSYFTCLEGSGRLNVSYSTCLEAQNVDKYMTFARFWDGRLREAKSVVFYVSGRLWEAQSVVFYGSGNSKPRKIQDICPVLGEVGRTGAAVWRVLAWFDVPCFFEGQSPFCRKGGISSEIIDFSRWGRKSASLKTSRLITSRL